MNKNITVVVLLSNLLYYVGIFFAVYLFLVDDNTPRWLLVIACIILGIVGSAIPDAMINVGIEKISIKRVRIGLLLKYFNFLICFTFLNIMTAATIFGNYYVLITDLIMQRKTSIVRRKKW